MKSVFAVALLLTGCVTAKVTVTKTATYECGCVGPHGVYAHWAGQYASLEEAQADAAIIGKRLFDKKLVPVEGTMCFEINEGDQK